MAQRKGTGLGKRSGYLDRDTIAENRAILREQSRSHEPGERSSRNERFRSRLMGVAAKSRRDDVRSAAEALVDRLVDGESPTEAAAGAERALLFVHGGDAAKTVQKDWERARDAVLATWARTIGKDTAEGEKVLAALPERPKADAAVRDALLAAGQADPAWGDVERGGVRLAELLASGWKFAPASAKAWKNLLERVGDLSDEERKVLGRKWASASRAVQNEWAKTHPEDAPTPPPARERRGPSVEERNERRNQKRREAVQAAAQTARSWPILQPEGQQLVDLVVEGSPFSEAARAAGAELETRREKLSEAEWALVRREWANILDVVSGAVNELRRSAPRPERPRSASESAPPEGTSEDAE